MARRAYSKTAFQGLVSGSPGQGKTTLVNAIAAGRRVVVFDNNGEYHAKGFHAVTTVRGFYGAVADRWHDPKLRVAFVPPPGGERQALSEISEALCTIQQPYKVTPDGRVPPIPKVLFIVEEMDASFPSHVYDGWFAEICGRRRHYGIDVLGVTLKPSLVSTRFRGTCDVQYFFAHHDHVDIQTIGKMVGPKHAAHVAHLQPHCYLRRFRGQISYGKNRLR
jgi:hypothetical protein